MYLTLTSTAPAATDLGYLLHKHPDRAAEFTLPFGTAHVFYPEATEERCTAALLLEVDPVSLVQGRRFRGDGFALGQYVNDRPYAASSLMSVALNQVFKTAMSGRCRARPDLEGTALPLQITLPSVASRGGAELVHRLFEPLGWQVRTTTSDLDPEHPDWGTSRYVDTVLTGRQTPARALTQLYVLLPVLDGAKHYWVSEDEVDKLLRAGEGWLADHPEQVLISTRYLAYRRRYVTTALQRLQEDEPDPEPDAGPDQDAGADATETGTEPAVPLNQLRQQAVLAELTAAGARRVVDLGCGTGALLRLLLADPELSEIVGVDVSARELEIAASRLHLDRMPERRRARITLLQGSATYRDDRLSGYDAIVLMEVVEHLDPDRLPALESSVFGHARPRLVVLTTPNVEFNVRYETLAPGRHRHGDHRFEWTRAELTSWAERVGSSHGYRVRVGGVGEDDPDLGQPTQLVVFTREEDADV